MQNSSGNGCGRRVTEEGERRGEKRLASNAIGACSSAARELVTGNGTGGSGSLRGATTGSGWGGNQFQFLEFAIFNQLASRSSVDIDLAAGASEAGSIISHAFLTRLYD